MNKPIVVFDGACKFCVRWIERWRVRTEDRVDYVSFQTPGVLRRLGISRSDARRAMQLVTTDGRRFEGAEAVFRTLEHAPELRTIARTGRLPLLRQIAQAVYRLIANHRSAADRVDRLLFGRETHLPGARQVRTMYMRALGGVYLIAFASLAPQIRGLYGRRGIRPIADYLAAVRPVLPPRERWRRMPTLFWLDARDETLLFACRAGQAVALLSMLGLAPRTTATLSWLLYLSFVVPGREFLSYQWDALLLENGLHAMVVAPSRRRERPTWTAVALMRWLAFRLQFESGHAKLASGDRTWRSGDACCVHFETQPLPTRGGWYAHAAPRPWKRLATYSTLALELGAPLLAFAPRRLRRAGFWLLSGLQGLIAATGNYGFFNVLTLVDNLWLLDDAKLARGKPPVRGERPSRWRRWLTALAALPIVALSGSMLVARMFKRSRIPEPLVRLHRAIAPLDSVNPYGLFAVMTTDRPEIVIEGSDDGVHWREYTFRYKQGSLKRPPRWAAPHQPRLDWQMWFAALEPAPPWFLQLMRRLLEGSPHVLGLFERVPFDHAPKYVRALLYDYHMTDRAARRETGDWWRRDLLGTYVQPLQLR